MSNFTGGRRNTIDIFVGGPMTNIADDGAGLSLSQHLPNLIEAIENIAKKLNAKHSHSDFPWIGVTNPMEKGFHGYIPEQIFRRIDQCDIGILDLSGPLRYSGTEYQLRERTSPNVIYEMALLHSLGIPVIQVALHGCERDFYLNQDYYHTVATFEVDELFSTLEPVISDLCLNYAAAFRAASSNPITRAYNNIALVDLSSTQGLATAYFDNFLRRFLIGGANIMNIIRGAKAGNSDFARLVVCKDPQSIKDLPNFSKLITIMPKALYELDSTRESYLAKQIERALNKTEVSFGGFSCYDPNFAWQVGREDARPYGFRFAGEYLYDLPAPLFSMVSSPRYRRAGKNGDRKFGAREFGSPEYNAKLIDYEMKIIASFFDLIDDSARDASIAENNYGMMSVDDFIKLVTS